MAIVKKGNTELTVPDIKVDEFLKMGYSEIDKGGKVLKGPETTNLAEVCKSLQEKVDGLTKQIEDLNKQLEAAKKKKDDK